MCVAAGGEMKGQGSWMPGMEGWRYKLWWYRKRLSWWCGRYSEGEVCEKVVEVAKVSDGMMAVVLVFEEYVERFICWYALQCG